MTETATVPTTTGDVNICNVLWSHNDDGTIRKRNSDADTSKICPEVKSQDVEYQTHICCPTASSHLGVHAPKAGLFLNNVYSLLFQFL
jgi:hypothetical protein